MQTQAYFDNIQHHLLQVLSQAQYNIYIAVAWFTDPSILRILEQKARNNVKIVLFLVDDEINQGNWGLDFTELIQNGGEVNWISQTLMHHKFCVIDRSRVISGSYNWTKKAARENRENIVIIEDASFVKQYLEELDFMYVHFAKKESHLSQTGLQKVDVLFFIKFEIRLLEQEIAQLETEIDYTQNTTSQFNLALKQALWNEIKVLQEWRVKIAEQKAINTQKPEDVKQFETSKEQFEEFERTQKTTNPNAKPPKVELNTNLKRLFYKVVKLCHPDLVKPEQQTEASKVFRLAKEASEKEDSQTLEKIYEQLVNGIAFSWNLEEIHEEDKLIKLRAQLQEKQEKLSLTLVELQNSQEWDVLLKHKDWQAYFELLRVSISEEIEDCKKIYKKNKPI